MTIPATKRKPKGLSTRLVDGSYTRHLDHWRQWAAAPLPTFNLTSKLDLETKETTWTLDADGKRVSTWLERDAPGLGGWLGPTLGKYHGAWHVARTELRAVAKKTRAAKKQGEGRTADAKDKDERIRKAAKEIIAMDGQMSWTELADRVSERAGLGAKSTLAKKLPKLLKRTRK